MHIKNGTVSRVKAFSDRLHTIAEHPPPQFPLHMQSQTICTLTPAEITEIVITWNQTGQTKQNLTG